MICISLTNSFVQSVLQPLPLLLVRYARPIFSGVPYIGFMRHGAQLNTVCIMGATGTARKLHDGGGDATMER